MHLRSRKSTLARIWRSKAEIFTLYLWNLYITVCQSYLSYTNQFHSISSSANHSICPSRSFVVVRFTRSRVMEMRASKSCFKQNAEEKFCGIGWFSSSGHKEQKWKICIFCRDRIQLQRRSMQNTWGMLYWFLRNSHLLLFQILLFEFFSGLWKTSIFINLKKLMFFFIGYDRRLLAPWHYQDPDQNTIKQKFKHCGISNDSLITQARAKRIWLKENLRTEAVLRIYNRMTPQRFQEVPISPQWRYYRRHTYNQLYTLQLWCLVHARFPQNLCPTTA